MSEKFPSNENESLDWEEILPKGDLELVSLNTMIPRKTSKALAEATGWLQLTSSGLRYTKQATVQYLLERGLQSLHEDIRKQDESESSHSEEAASNVLDLIKAGKREYNLKEYESFANKTTGGYKYNR